MKSKTTLPTMPWAASHLWEMKLNTLLIISLSVSIMGIGEGFLILAQLGVTPWTVLSQGIALQANISIGMSIALVSIAVLLLWIPFKLKIGFGTLINIALIALFVDLTTRFIPAPESLVARVAFMLFGILIFGIGTTFYLSCRLGAGPRDGLMVGLCQKFGWNVGRVRTGIEISVCLLGILLGGTFGLSTIVFALSVGWIIQGTFSLLTKLISQAV